MSKSRPRSLPKLRTSSSLAVSSPLSSCSCTRRSSIERFSCSSLVTDRFNCLVLVFQMAQTRLELANGRSARQEGFASRTTRHHAHSQPDQGRASAARSAVSSQLERARIGTRIVRRVAGRKQIAPRVAFAMKCPAGYTVEVDADSIQQIPTIYFRQFDQ